MTYQYQVVLASNACRVSECAMTSLATQDRRGQHECAHLQDAGVRDDQRLEGRQPHVLRVEGLSPDRAPARGVRDLLGGAGGVGPTPVRPPLRVRGGREGLRAEPGRPALPRRAEWKRMNE